MGPGGDGDRWHKGMVQALAASVGIRWYLQGHQASLLGLSDDESWQLPESVVVVVQQLFQGFSCSSCN